MHEKPPLTDSDLVALVLKRDAHAFEMLFERYADALQRHVSHIVHDETTAHDVVQETFLRVWTRIDQWHGDGSLRAWLYRIATNLALNHIRTVQRRRELPLTPPPDIDDEDTANLVPAWVVDASTLGPEAVFEQAEERARYRQLVNRLPEEKREVFRLVHEMEMSLRDAADALNIPEGTVKSRLHYAKKRLAREWREMEDGRWKLEIRN
jgi:RNA polymerase sigma-70 factor (ECF subfamily)